MLAPQIPENKWALPFSPGPQNTQEEAEPQGEEAVSF